MNHDITFNYNMTFLYLTLLHLIFSGAVDSNETDESRNPEAIDNETTINSFFENKSYQAEKEKKLAELQSLNQQESIETKRVEHKPTFGYIEVHNLFNGLQEFPIEKLKEILKILNAMYLTEKGQPLPFSQNTGKQESLNELISNFKKSLNFKEFDISALKYKKKFLILTFFDLYLSEQLGKIDNSFYYNLALTVENLIHRKKADQKVKKELTTKNTRQASN